MTPSSGFVRFQLTCFDRGFHLIHLQVFELLSCHHITSLSIGGQPCFCLVQVVDISVVDSVIGHEHARYFQHWSATG